MHMHHIRKHHSPTLHVGATTLDALLDSSVGPSTLDAVADLMTPKKRASTKRKTGSSTKRRMSGSSSTKRKTSSAKKKTTTKKTTKRALKPCPPGKVRDRLTRRCRAPRK